MLVLKRVLHFNDFLKCDVSREIIRYGDYYYEDDEDGTIIKASVYGELKKQRKWEEYDYTKFNQAQSERDYRQMLRQYEREFLMQNVLDRKIQGKDAY